LEGDEAYNNGIDADRAFESYDYYSSDSYSTVMDKAAPRTILTIEQICSCQIRDTVFNISDKVLSSAPMLSESNKVASATPKVPREPSKENRGFEV